MTDKKKKHQHVLHHQTYGGIPPNISAVRTSWKHWPEQWSNKDYTLQVNAPTLTKIASQVWILNPLKGRQYNTYILTSAFENSAHRKTDSPSTNSLSSSQLHK